MRRLAALTLAIAAIAPAAHAHQDAAPVVRAFTRGSGYATGAGFGDSELIIPNLYLPAGSRLLFTNLHVWGHSMYSDAWAPGQTGERRLFNSEVIPFGDTSEVVGVADLPPGDYGFFCSNHMGMRGSLHILPT